MIDTVKIVVPFHCCQINESKFKPKQYHGYYTKYEEHILSRKSNFYYPRVSYRKAKEYNNAEILEIEFSVSKLIKGENLLSFRQDIKEAFFIRLQSILEQMEIKTSIQALKTARLTKVHPCINLITNAPANLIIEDIARGYFLKKDVEMTPFRNGGSIVHIHNKFKEYALYDKTLDMQQAELKAKQYFDGNSWQNPPFLYANYLRDLNIIRFEARFNSKSEIEKAFGKKMTLGEIFDDQLIKRVLLSAWKVIMSGTETLPKADMKMADIISAIKHNYPNKRPDKIMELATTVQLLSTQGDRKTLNTLAHIYQSKEKTKHYIKEAINLNLPKYKPNYLAQITEGIEAFKPLDIKALTEARKSYTGSLDPNFNMYGFLTVEEIADKLKCTTRHIQKEIQTGRLIGYKIGKLWRVREHDFLVYLGNRRTKRKTNNKEDKQDENK